MRTLHDPTPNGLLRNRLALIIFSCLLTQITFAQAPDTSAPQHYISGPMGTQVNSYTGNLFYSRSDLHLPGIGLPLDVTFYFNTQKADTSMGFGRGWTWSLNIYYQYDPLNPSNIIIHRGHEKKDKFKFYGGQYHAPMLVTDTLYEYLTGKYKLQQTNGTIFYFDDAVVKKITKITDRNGNNIIFTYSGDYVSTITNSAGFTLSFTWSGGKLSKIADNSTPTPRVVNYTYTGASLTKVQDPEGYFTEYTYLGGLLMGSVSDGNGNVSSIKYDFGTNRVSNINWPQSIKGMYIVYDILQKKTTTIEMIVGSDRTTIYQFDAKKRMIKETNPAGGIMLYSFDANNYISGVTDFNGNQTFYLHDSIGRKLKQTDAMGYSQTYTYNNICGCNKPATSTDKKGYTTNYEYDANGNLTKRIYPDGKSDQYTYNANGLMATYIDPNGHITQYNYNGSGFLTLVVMPIGTLTMSYDSRGNKLTQTNPLGHTTTFSYDKLDRTLTEIDALAHTTTYTYDGVGNLKTMTDANGKLTQYQYDALNRIIQVQKPLGTNGYTYDGAGNMRTMTNPLGRTTFHTYDVLDRLKTETDPAGHTTTYSYDNNGNTLTKGQPNGQLLTYAYDALNRRVSRSYTGNTENFSYDANGNLTVANNNNLAFSYTYDSRDRLMTKAINTWGKSITYSYDNKGNVATMKDADNGNTTYTYDAMDRLINLQNPFTETAGYTRDISGRTTKMTHANGSYADYSYDNANRLIGLQNKKSGGSVISNYNYSLDNVGNSTSMTDITGINNYVYDNIYQLTTALYSDGSRDDYAYDDWGNRQNAVHNLTQVTVYTHDIADRMIKANNDSLVYDTNGNLTKMIKGTDTTRYNYDGANHMTGIILPTGKTMQMVYGPDQLRYVLTDTNNVQTRYVYDRMNAIMELDNNNATVRRYTAAEGLDNWISMRHGGNSYHYHKDGLGSTTGLTDGTETLRQSYGFDAYGNIAKDSGNLINPHLYTGYRYDIQGRLYYNRNRYYSPFLGRFIQLDPIGQVDDLNLFGYVENNPVNWNDPNGTIIGIAFAMYNLYKCIKKADKDNDDRLELCLGLPCPEVPACIDNSMKIYYLDIGICATNYLAASLQSMAIGSSLKSAFNGFKNYINIAGSLGR